MADSIAADLIELEDKKGVEPVAAPTPLVEVDAASLRAAEEAKDAANKLFKGIHVTLHQRGMFAA